MTQTTRQKLDADPHIAYLIDELPLEVKLGATSWATEEHPWLQIEVLEADDAART